MISHREIERQKALLQQAQAQFSQSTNQQASRTNHLSDLIDRQKASLDRSHRTRYRSSSTPRSPQLESPDGIHDTPKLTRHRSSNYNSTLGQPQSFVINLSSDVVRTDNGEMYSSNSNKLSNLADAAVLREMERQLNLSRERRRAREREQRAEREKLRAKMQQLANDKDVMNETITQLADRLVTAETQLNQSSNSGNIAPSATGYESDDCPMIYNEMDLLMSLSRPS